MFSRKRESTLLEDEIDRALRALNRELVGSEEYLKTMGIVTKLHGLKTNEKSSPVSKDTLAVIGGNLLGIIMIIKHEHLNPITSRAMQLLLRPRI